MLLNLIVSELAIAAIGIPVDFYNSITRGVNLDNFICPIVGFIHTFFGELIIRFNFQTYDSASLYDRSEINHILLQG